MISIKDDAVNTHSIVSTMTSEDESDSKHTATIHVFQNPGAESGVEPVFAVSCKAIYPSDDSVVEHKFTLSLAGFENLVLAWEDLMKDPEKYKHAIADSILKEQHATS